MKEVPQGSPATLNAPPGVTECHGYSAPGLSGPLVFQLLEHGSPKEYPQCAVASPGGSKASRREPPQCQGQGICRERISESYRVVPWFFSKFVGHYYLIYLYRYYLIIGIRNGKKWASARCTTSDNLQALDPKKTGTAGPEKNEKPLIPPGLMAEPSPKC
jgi:hypothetical protein